MRGGGWWGEENDFFFQASKLRLPVCRYPF
jgi:hypothetical protein